MNKKKIVLTGSLIFFLAAHLSSAGYSEEAQKFRVVTTSTTLASLVKDIAGDTAEVDYVASPKRNLHFISPTPKDVLRVKKADVFVHHGLDLELWRDPLLDAAGNARLIGKADGTIDVSKGIALLEIPSAISRAEGDIHIYGNPHYWTDPENMKIASDNVVVGLSRNFPDKSDLFKGNGGRFKSRLDEKLNAWTERMKPFAGTPVVTYHRTWPYFAKRFGLDVVGYLEPKPGIPPTAKHLSGLIRICQERKVRLIIREVYNESGTAKKLAEETGAKVIVLAQSVGETGDSTDYISMMDSNIRLIEDALNGKGVENV